MPRYKILESNEEIPMERLLANTARDAAVLELRIAKPSLHFIREAWRGDISFPYAVRGFAEPRGIFLLEGLKPRDILQSAAHECEHVRQRGTGLEKERKAELFARSFSLLFHSENTVDLLAELRAFINFKMATEAERRRRSTGNQKQPRRPMTAREKSESDRLRRQFAPLLSKRNTYLVGEKIAGRFPQGFEMSIARGDLRICNR